MFGYAAAFRGSGKNSAGEGKPQPGLTLASDGRLYGATQYYFGTFDVFAVNPAIIDWPPVPVPHRHWERLFSGSSIPLPNEFGDHALG